MYLKDFIKTFYKILYYILIVCFIILIVGGLLYLRFTFDKWYINWLLN